MILVNGKYFCSIWDNLLLLKKVSKPKYSLEETMQEYIESNSSEQDAYDAQGQLIDFVDLVNRAGHGQVLEALYQVLFERLDPKINVVWIYGVANSGKTTLIEMLHRIFCCQDFNFREKYCTLEQATKDDCAVQLMTSIEFEVDQAFTVLNYTQMKRLFEGRGATLSNNKFVPLEKQHEGLQFIIASNKLPRCANSLHMDYDDMWQPMLCRMKLVHLTKKFPGETKFPYSDVELAAALTQMIN